MPPPTEYIKKSVTVKDYQAQWLEEEDQSPSAILQAAIDDRMVSYGFDPDTWEKSEGNGE